MRTLIVCVAARVGWLVMSHLVGYSFGVTIPVNEAAASYWFIWALGALSVEAALGVTKLPEWSYKISVACVVLVGAMVYSQAITLLDDRTFIHDVAWLVMHPIWGVGFFILVNYSVRAEQRWRLISSHVPRLITVLAPIGVMSYSLYLVHHLVLMQWYWFGFTKLHILSISLLISTPLSVAIAWVFFRICERPFMTPIGMVTVPARPRYAPTEDQAREVA